MVWTLVSTGRSLRSAQAGTGQAAKRAWGRDGVTGWHLGPKTGRDRPATVIPGGAVNQAAP
ncbi:MAG: hypothetical protein Q7J57_18530 [Gemmobacter sp.]|nr:hypothetical protein [Gemmobacter sp.]